MFVGHYGVSFVAKRADNTIPLWVLFIAVQLLDVFWSGRVPAFLLEVAMLFGGMLLYLRSTPATTRFGRWGFPVFGILMLAIQAGAFFGPPPGAGWVAAVEALVLYIVFAAIAGWLERARG